MNFTLATNEQLWNIMKYDKECPLSLLEGIFREAVDRGMIQQSIIHVIKVKGIKPETNKEFGITYDDFIQIGYEGALKALREFQPGRGKFTDVLFHMISQAIGQFFVVQRAQKRKGNLVSYQNFLSNKSEETMEIYLLDRKMNVEKTVLTKIALEEKLKKLSDVQRETFKRYFVGYTLPEIAEQMNTKKSTVQGRLEKAFIKMTGHKVNLVALGYERVKKQGA
jgi:RNA polymerase sigma factor (sigma-70 family)